MKTKELKMISPEIAGIVGALIVIGVLSAIGAASTPRGVAFPDVALAAVGLNRLSAVTEWEHGFKTDRVIATRYTNDAIGYNIGFTFPKNPDDCDRAEIFDFMQAHDGWIYQGGGYPGAEAYVKFKDVTDKDSADKKIREILPALSQLITDLGNGKTVKIDLPKPQYEWPDTSPPDKSDPYWESNNNVYINGTAYLKVEVSPGKWQWQVDEKAMKVMADMESHRRMLWQALNSRVLTDEEMKEVAGYGDYLNTESMVPYNAEEKTRELKDALLRQLQMRAAQGSAPASTP